jgi:hypothetical protein
MSVRLGIGLDSRSDSAAASRSFKRFIAIEESFAPQVVQKKPDPD